LRDKPALSIIIVSWNVQADLQQCLTSLQANADSPHEVIVVDNDSHDGTREYLASLSHVQAVCNDSNRGFAAANNQGLMIAEGTQWLLLLNPDTIVPAGALRELLAFAASQPQAGVVGPRLLNSDGSLQYSCRHFPSIWAAMFRHTLLGRLFPQAAATRDYLMADWDHATVREVDWVSGACLLLRREVYEQIGGLDEGFFWGSEDVDLCLRVKQAGWQVWYTPRPAITHAIGRSTDQAIVATIIRTHRGMQRLYVKHFARNVFSRLLVTAGVWLRAGLLLLSVWFRRNIWSQLPGRRGEG
jgi:GT2 family glycosyltransferase